MKPWHLIALGAAAVAVGVALGGDGKGEPEVDPTPDPDPAPAKPTTTKCSRSSFAGLGFVEVLTGGASTADDVPVHVFLHGRGTKPGSLAPYVAKIPARARHLLLEGPVKLPGGGRAWTVARCADLDQVKLAAQTTWTADLLEKALTEIAECYGRNVVLSGFSNGAMLAYAIAARNLPVVDGVVAQAGCLPESMRAPMRNTVGIHGTADAVVPFAGTDSFATLLGVEWYPVEGGGHDSAEAVELWREAVGRMLT